jgi:hypothetical protein
MFFVNIVTEPPFLDMRILPRHHKEILSEAYDNHIEFLSSSKGLNGQMPSVNSRRGFLSLKHHLLQTHPETERNLLEAFKFKMKRLDEIREEDFAKTFPEMKDLVGG